MDWNKLEEQASLLMARVSEYEQNAINAIVDRVVRIGKMSSYDKQALKNASKWSTQDMNTVIADIAKSLNKTIPEMQAMYLDVLGDTVSDKSDLYEHTGITPPTLADDKKAQSIVKYYAKATGETMINLTKTSALNLVSPDGITRPFATVAEQVFAEAVTAVTTGTQDFASVMRQSLARLGGGGVQIQFASGRHYRLDSILRMNLLDSSKACHQEYDEIIGQQLNCDIRFISAHSNCADDHKSINGGVYAIGKARTINGVRYESDNDVLNMLKRPNCRHDSSTGIAGVSEPALSKSELDKLNADEAKMISYNGKEKNKAGWSNAQRNLQLRIRKEKDVANTLKNANDMVGRRIQQVKINKLQAQLTALEKGTGLIPSPERASVSSFRAVKPSE